jgi:hypothetical protein
MKIPCCNFDKYFTINVKLCFESFKMFLLNFQFYQFVNKMVSRAEYEQTLRQHFSKTLCFYIRIYRALFGSWGLGSQQEIASEPCPQQPYREF